MLRIHSKALCLVVLALALATNALAGEGDTLITDAALLTRLGFPLNARNVYLAKGAVLDQRSTLAEPEEFGISDFGWTTVLGNQSNPLRGSAEYTAPFLSADGSITRISGDNYFDAQLQMPSGALLQQVVWFGVDNDGGQFAGVNGVIVRVCQTGIPPGPPVVTLLGSSSSDDGDFTFAVVVPGGEVVRNLNCAYTARSIFLGAAGDLTLRKVRAGWQRQVSPAPATATFPNDTPTTHPYFRFIEALAASGITAGCAPGSYCPNNPITRGEMAVFLSVALGLHFTN